MVDNSDAGPDVGVTNFEVRFRDAELTLLYRRDYGCRVHSARGCSGDNEAERMDSAVGDSIVDGATLQWERYPRFHNLSDDEIANLTIKEFDAHEEERMEMNAWWVAEELANRIDGAPVFNEYIHSFVTEKPSDAFFFNRKYLKEFNRKSGNPRKEVPGYFYAMNITNFIELHHRVGELYMEFIKAGCMEMGEQCSWCKETKWIGLKFERVPEPHPDSQRKGQYMEVFETPNYADEAEKVCRPVDEFAPRAVLRQLFSENKIGIKDHTAIEQFSDKYCVEEKHVESYLQHLEEQRTAALIRSREKQLNKQQQKSKSYVDYNWNQLVCDGTLRSLTMNQLKRVTLIIINFQKLAKSLTG